MLSELYSVMLSRSCVPSVFHTGLIIPILKKSTPNPNLAKNYRPVTLSSIHTKLVEQTMTPAADISDNQYGFRDGRGTGMACSLLNDVITHCKYQKSTLFVASLDAEKCFDSICHISLFVKLIDVIPVYEWLFLHEWYSQLNAMVKWNGKYSKLFKLTQLNVKSSRGALKNSMKTILMNDYATLVNCENPRCIDCQLIT